MSFAAMPMEKLMKSNSPINETVIANELVAILERLDALEKATSVLAAQHLASATTPTLHKANLHQKLEKLTLKRHAVLTATLGGQSYQQIGKLMNCDETTVKLHLKAALNTLSIRNRSLLLATSSDLLQPFSDSEYESRYGLSKCWWVTEDSRLMAVLRACKPAHNQHTK